MTNVPSSFEPPERITLAPLPIDREASRQVYVHRARPAAAAINLRALKACEDPVTWRKFAMTQLWNMLAMPKRWLGKDAAHLEVSWALLTLQDAPILHAVLARVASTADETTRSTVIAALQDLAHRGTDDVTSNPLAAAGLLLIAGGRIEDGLHTMMKEEIAQHPFATFVLSVAFPNDGTDDESEYDQLLTEGVVRNFLDAFDEDRALNRQAEVDLAVVDSGTDLDEPTEVPELGAAMDRLYGRDK